MSGWIETASQLLTDRSMSLHYGEELRYFRTDDSRTTRNLDELEVRQGDTTMLEGIDYERDGDTFRLITGGRIDNWQHVHLSYQSGRHPIDKSSKM